MLVMLILALLFDNFNIWFPMGLFQLSVFFLALFHVFLSFLWARIFFSYVSDTVFVTCRNNFRSRMVLFIFLQGEEKHNFRIRRIGSRFVVSAGVFQLPGYPYIVGEQHPVIVSVLGKAAKCYELSPRLSTYLFRNLQTPPRKKKENKC